MLGVLGISKCKILALFAFILIWRTSSTSSCQYIPLHTVGHLFFQTFLLDYVFKMDETICASYAHDNNHISNNAEMIQKNCPIDHESWKHTAINASFCFFSFFFFLHFQVEDYQNMLKQRCWPLTFSFYKAFLKNKRRSGTNLPASFSAWFLKKNIFHVIFY